MIGDDETDIIGTLGPVIVYQIEILRVATESSVPKTLELVFTRPCNTSSWAIALWRLSGGTGVCDLPAKEPGRFS